MSYRTVLLHLDDQPHGGACVDFAADLARRFDARLLGLSCHLPTPWPSDGAIAFVAGDPISAELRAARDAAESREIDFKRRCANAGLSSFETLRDDAAPLAALGVHALAADLVVMGQADPDADCRSECEALVHNVLRQSAHPVLVVPCRGAARAAAGKVVVAWDDSVGAARAPTAALPLLQRASAVHLVRFQPPRQGDAPDRVGLDRAAAWLSRHGVPVRCRLSASESPVGQALLDEVADVGAGLLVMGAWGQGRLLERVIGGATRAITAGMTVPVLFAH